MKRPLRFGLLILICVSSGVVCAGVGQGTGHVRAVLAPAANSRMLLTANDLNWEGMLGFPGGGPFTPGSPGWMRYASGALAVRYVNGQRRFLVPTFTQIDPKTGQTWGDLVEWQEPGALFAGADAGQAPQLVETRRWASWTMLATTPTWQDGASGVRIGGLYWDEAHRLLWYQLYGYYSNRNRPLLAATQLLDTDVGGGYQKVGTKHGPWWYRDNNPADLTRLYWKAVNYWLTPIPASAQPDLGNRRMIIGASVGSVGGAGNIGPGFHAIADLPLLTDPPNSIIPMGLRLADYSREPVPGKPSRNETQRDSAYNFDNNPSNQSGLQPAVNGVGRWQMSLDQVNSFIWVETATRHGILLFGRQAHGTTWYGFNPRSRDPQYKGPPDAIDPSRGNPDGNGYGATQWAAALYVFDPMHVREVGLGQRSPYSDGMKPTTYDWHKQWPNIPKGGGRFIDSSISNTGFWDAKAQQVIWIQPVSAGARPTVHFFTVKP